MTYVCYATFEIVSVQTSELQFSLVQAHSVSFVNYRDCYGNFVVINVYYDKMDRVRTKTLKKSARIIIELYYTRHKKKQESM